MREITVRISDRVFLDLQNSLALSSLAETGGGVVHAMAKKIVHSLLGEEKEVDIMYKSEGIKGEDE